jgi:hypothetical protein
MNKVFSKLTAKPILTRLVRANGVPLAGQEILIEANKVQCAALAKLNKLAALNRLQALLTVKPRGKELHVWGTITADVVYTCVFTLEQFPFSLVEKVNAIFAPEKEVQKPKHLDLSFGDDDREALIDGEADIGALVQELFQLALDPYPHKPGTNFINVTVPDNVRPVRIIKN